MTWKHVWQTLARRVHVAPGDDLAAASASNALVLQPPPTASLTELTEALQTVRSEYLAAIARARRSGMLYFWNDEPSGTVRCSFCETSEFRDLPFSCVLKRAGSLDDIALAAAGPLREIPRRELAEVAWSDPDEKTGPAFELPVYAELVPVAQVR